MHHTMVPSDRVEHVAVYGRDGTKLGTVERLMIDKASGTVTYAVIKTGGLLDTHHHYPVLWGALRYDPGVSLPTELTLDELEHRPVRVRRRDLTGATARGPIRTRSTGQWADLFAHAPPLARRPVP